VVWDDLARGESHVDVTSLSDPVLIRDDGSYLYTLPSVVDDVDFTVTHVIRGEDHVTNTAAQIQLFEALEAEPPQFAHHNLLTGTDGQTLSKRLGSLSIEGFRKSGLEPLAVVSHAATIGSSEPVAPHFSMDEMADLFDFTKLSHAPARFDERELFNLNAKFLHAATFDSMKDRLAALGLPEDEELWEAVHGNIERLKDIKIWQQVIAGEMKPVIGDARFCRKAAELLPPEPWDEATWEQWVSAVKSATGAKGRALFMPLRQAITGMDNGPELKKLLPMIGRKQVIDRLSR
jgi:glutamyl-tRNA synthetase